MNIKILGPGCAKCHELDKRVREVAKELGLDVGIEYVQDIEKIMEHPILTTPGLVLDGKIVCSGKVPSKSEIKGFISKGL
jgi:small redox-active disulfide protein 2